MKKRYAIQPILLLSVALSLWGCPSQNKGQDSPPDKAHSETKTTAQGKSALLVVEGERIEPVAVYNGANHTWEDPFLPLRQLTDSEAMNQANENMLQTYLPLNQPLDLYLQGKKQGQFTPTQSGLFGCGDFAHVTGSFSDPKLKGPSYLSFSSQFPGRRSYEAPEWYVPQLQHTALELARKTFSQSGYDLDSNPLEVVSHVPLSLQAQGKWLKVLFVVAKIPHHEAEFTCPQAKLWLMAEGDSPTQMQVKHFKITAKTGNGDACGDHRLISTLNTTGQVDQILIGNTGYEWWDYTLVQRQDNGSYNDVYNGGGGGC